MWFGTIKIWVVFEIWDYHFSGVIDFDYTGPIKIIIFNYGKKDFVLTPDLRLAQLVILRIADPFLVEVKELEKTERGDSGFESSGYHLFFYLELMWSISERFDFCARM